MVIIHHLIQRYKLSAYSQDPEQLSGIEYTSNNLVTKRKKSLTMIVVQFFKKIVHIKIQHTDEFLSNYSFINMNYSIKEKIYISTHTS